jgi:hypothetical protein
MIMESWAAHMAGSVLSTFSLGALCFRLMLDLERMLHEHEARGGGTPVLREPRWLPAVSGVTQEGARTWPR